MADVIITPASGLIDFQNTSGISSATIQLNGSGDLIIGAAAGDIQIGDTSSDIFVGDGVNNVDIVFEQNGEIRGDTGVTVTLGQSDSYIAFAGDVTGDVDFTGGLNVSGITTSSRFVSNVATGTAPFTVSSTTVVTNLNADTVDGIQASSFLRSDAADTATGAITFSGGQTWNSNITWNTGQNITIAGESSFDVGSGGSWSVWDASTTNNWIQASYGQPLYLNNNALTTIVNTSNSIDYFRVRHRSDTDITMDFYCESNTTQVADTFSGTTDKKYIVFSNPNSSNDPGYIMHETRGGESNEGVLHLCPSDDNAEGDYVSIHGTNDADQLRLHTNSLIESVNSQLTLKSGSDQVYVNDDLKISGGIHDGTSLGTSGQVLSSTGTGLSWIDAAGGGGGGTSGLSTGGVYVGSGVTTFNFVGTGITASVTGSTGNVYIPTASRSVSRTVATNGQTTVTGLSYTVGFVDVYLNGARLDSTEFTASNGSSVVLTTGASTGDIIEIVSESVSNSISLTGLSDVVSDTTPQLGGNLDLNSRNITGTGNINITGTINASGIITGSSFSGSGANLTSVNASTVTVADESSDTSCNVLYSTSATGDLAVKSGTNLTFNSSSGTLSATTFSGSGASLTSVNAATVTLTDETTDTTCFPLFATDATGDRAIKTDGATLTYNASTGTLAASLFSGSGASLTSVNAATSTVANEATDTSCFPLFATAASGSLALKSSSNLTYDSSTGVLTAQAFSGDGSALTSLSITNIPVANEATDTSCFPLFATAATGSQTIKSNASLTFNSSNGTLSASTFAGSADLSGLLKEDVNVTAGKLSDNQNINLSDGMVHLFTTAETTTSTPNIRYDASNTLNSKMNTGESVAVSVIVTAAAAGYGNTITVDGAAEGINWLGGSAPSTGGSSGYDNYTYNIIKTADATFTVLANLVNFA